MALIRFVGKKGKGATATSVGRLKEEGDGEATTKRPKKNDVIGTRWVRRPNTGAALRGHSSTLCIRHAQSTRKDSAANSEAKGELRGMNVQA